MRAETSHLWDLDPAAHIVNHGSYGATPRSVMAAQDAWRQRMEAAPTRFMMRDVPPATRAAAARLAGFLGARPQDTVFVENATVGCNAVLGSFPLAAGDEVLVLSHGYGAVIKAARHVCARAGARVTEAVVPFPRPDPDAVVAGITAAITSRTRLAVLDHITSASGLELPVAAMVAACRAHGVPVLVDGAHAPGQVPLDVPSIGADWYVGNCHKWLFAPKGAGFLWAAPHRQDGLHPVTISHGYGDGFLAEFDWTGTRDPSAWLCVPDGIAVHASLGGPALMARNAALAAEAAAMLAGRFGTETGTGNAPTCAMAIVRLPLYGLVDGERAAAVREALIDGGSDAPVNAIEGAAWLRVSAQAYNDLADYEALAGRVQAVLA